MTRRRVLGAVALASLALAGVAGADGTPLEGTVGPGFTITLKDAAGATVTHLDPGAYDLAVADVSDEHDFHLFGPGGVDVTTDVVGVESKTFALTLVDGTYTFLCDAHPTRMKGSFTVGTATAPPPTTPPPAPRLALAVTDRAVSLRTPAGKVVRSLAAGTYVVQVTDRSKKQNAHLVGAGVNRRTGIAFVGKATWKITLSAGTLTLRSDARSPRLRAGKIAVRSS